MHFNAKALNRVLMQSDEEDFSQIGSVNKYMPEVSVNDLRNSLKEAFEKELKIKIISDNPTEFELNLARELEGKKYSA